MVGKSRLFLFALGVVAAVHPAAFPGAAVADHLAEDMPLPADGTPRTVIALEPVILQAGERRYLWSVVTMNGPANVNSPNYLYACKISCVGPAPLDPRGVWTTTNWRGHDQDPAGIDQKIHFLLVAPVAGIYYCSLDVYAATNNPPTPAPIMTVMAGENITYLKMSSVDETMAEQWATRIHHEEFPVGTETYMLRKTFAARPTATNVVAVSDLELTTCYAGTASCESEGAPGVGGTQVETQLVVAQLDAAGSPCVGWTADPPSGVLSTYIDNATHHRKVYHTLSVPKSDAAPCTDMFAIKTLLRVPSGNPLRVEHDTGTMLYTNGIALNRGGPPPVGVPGSPATVEVGLLAAPNPSRGEVVFTGLTTGGAGSRGMLRVFDVQGRQILQRALTITDRRFREVWGTSEAASDRPANGVYLARIEVGRELMRTHFVILQ